jgi:hydroxyacylglutathione hydrolase
MSSEEKLLSRPLWSPTLEPLADRVWLLRGDVKRGMNVYFIEDGDGVIQFDAGTKPMVKAVEAASEKLGPIKAIVLGHSHTDHRGTAPFLAAPVLCHPDEVTYAERDAWPDYWDISKISVGWARRIYPSLHRRWDGGAVKISDTVSEGDEVAGFRVHHFPGHAPGQIGLFRETDRLALVTDTIYLIDSERLKPLPEGEASVAHPAWNWDHAKAKESVRKLAELEPATIAAGHDEPCSGPGIPEMLESAAGKY